LFEQQPREHRETVLPLSPRAFPWSKASVLGWARYVGPRGRMIGIDTFGLSAPLKEVQKKFGFLPATVVAAAREVLA
jgi:transketolase